MGLRRIFPAVLMSIAVITLLTLIVSTSVLAQSDIERSSGPIVDHPPIDINTNIDFTAPNGVSAGSGIKTDPWIIEGFNITPFFSEPCIQIKNTNEFVTIRNCTLSGNSNTFIKINNCS